MAAIPTLVDLVAHTTARAADVDANFAALLAMLDPSSGPDGGIDGVNLKQGSPGQLWIADGSGVYQREDVSGDATLASNGVLTIGDNKVGPNKLVLAADQDSAGADVNLSSSYVAISTIAAGPLDAGDYLILGSTTVSTFSAGLNVDVFVKLDDDGTGAARAEGTVGDGAGSQNPASFTVFEWRTLDGSTSVRLQAKTGSGVSPGSIKASGGSNRTRLLAIRLN